MNEYVMRHPKLPGQPVIVQANDESELAGGEMERAGWKLAKTDPEQVRDEAALPPEPAEPVNPKKK